MSRRHPLLRPLLVPFAVVAVACGACGNISEEVSQDSMVEASYLIRQTADGPNKEAALLVAETGFIQARNGKMKGLEASSFVVDARAFAADGQISDGELIQLQDYAFSLPKGVDVAAERQTLMALEADIPGQLQAEAEAEAKRDAGKYAEWTFEDLQRAGEALGAETEDCGSYSDEEQTEHECSFKLEGQYIEVQTLTLATLDDAKWYVEDDRAEGIAAERQFKTLFRVEAYDVAGARKLGEQVQALGPRVQGIDGAAFQKVIQAAYPTARCSTSTDPDWSEDWCEWNTSTSFGYASLDRKRKPDNDGSEYRSADWNRYEWEQSDGDLDIEILDKAASKDWLKRVEDQIEQSAVDAVGGQ